MTLKEEGLSGSEGTDVVLEWSFASGQFGDGGPGPIFFS